MSYWCYSLWRNLCYSSLCDYYCCCDCAPRGTLLRSSTSGVKGMHHHVGDKDDDWGITRDEDGRLHVSPDNPHNPHRMYIPHPVLSASDNDNSPTSPNGLLTSKEEPQNSSMAATESISRSASISPKHHTKQHKNTHILLANDDEEENDNFLDTGITEITFGGVSTASATTGEDGWQQSQYRSWSVASNSSSNTKIGLIPPPPTSSPKNSNAEFFDHANTNDITENNDVNARNLARDKELAKEELEILKELESALSANQNN